MTAEARSLSGLGYPPDLHSQNANECMNAVIKRGQTKKMDLADCIEHLRKEVNNQQSMKKLAMISRGELSVSDDFNSFLIDEDDFFAVHVKLSGRGDVSYDTTCLRWAAYKLCSHTIAVAEKEAVLANFLKKFAKASREPNLTGLAVHDMPKGRDKKATKATRRRKGEGGTRGAVCT